jgi:hypothetical protein
VGTRSLERRGSHSPLVWKLGFDQCLPLTVLLGCNNPYQCQDKMQSQKWGTGL